MKNVFIVLLVGVGAGLLIILLKFGTIDPCGIVRAEIRQAGARAGGFGGVVVAALPDSVIDGMIAARYGPLSPGRCVSWAFEGTPLQVPPTPPAQPQASTTVTAPPRTAAALDQAAEETKTAITECKNKRLSGELKTYMASAECSNPRILAAFRRAGYRYMDLIYLITAKRRELAEQVDNGTLTEAQAELEAAQLMVRVVNEEQQRDRRRR